MWWTRAITAVLFILGVMLLRSPATARRGNYLSALGMLVALVSSGWNGRLPGQE